MAAASIATPQRSSKSPTIRRIMREAAEILGSPSADYTAEPLDSDLFEWHFTLRGPPKSVYSEGLYHGRIVLPPTYPLRPPSFRFTTPNGRFEANREICLSISGHHEETWQPAWGIRTAIVALRSFMETDARGQLGGLETTDDARRRFALESRAFKCSICGRSNLDIITQAEQQSKEMSSSSRTQVPLELNMAWRDEMEKKSEAPMSKKADIIRDDDSDDAALAEGFVQTVPISRQADGEVPRLLPQANEEMTYVTPETRQRSLATAEMSTEGGRRATFPQIVTTQRRGDGVPLWIDRAIVALVIILTALLLKVLLGV